MKRYDRAFKNCITSIDFTTLEKSPNAVFGLSKNLDLVYFNKAWFNFSKENKGEPGISRHFPIGTPIGNAISGNLKEYYLNKYQEVLDTKKVWKHEYECSSPSLFRIFHQITYPLKNNEGLIIVNSLKIERNIDVANDNVLPFKEENYIQKTGYINQCSNCRRTQRVKKSLVWDWVPIFLEKIPEKMSHTICPVCYDYYWKNAIKNKDY